MATHSSVLAWRISWTDEPAGYSPWDRKELDTTEQLNHCTVNCNTYIWFWWENLVLPSRLVSTRPLGLFPPSCSSALGHL